MCDRSYLSELTCFALYFHPCEVSPWPYRLAWLSHTALPAAGRASGSAVWYGPIPPDRAQSSKEAQEGGQGHLQHPWGWDGDMSSCRAHGETCGRFTPAAWLLWLVVVGWPPWRAAHGPACCCHGAAPSERAVLGWVAVTRQPGRSRALRSWSHSAGTVPQRPPLEAPGWGRM